jgi:hypothetical protein
MEIKYPTKKELQKELEQLEIITQFYPPEPPLVPNLDTSTEEGQRWRLHVLQKPLREWEAKESLRDQDWYFD